MDINKTINEYGIDLGIDMIIQKISEKTNEYRLNPNENTAKEIEQLLIDRNKIYDFDKQTIMKYMKLYLMD